MISGLSAIIKYTIISPTLHSCPSPSLHVDVLPYVDVAVAPGSGVPGSLRRILVVPAAPPCLVDLVRVASSFSTASSTGVRSPLLPLAPSRPTPVIWITKENVGFVIIIYGTLKSYINTEFLHKIITNKNIFYYISSLSQNMSNFLNFFAVSGSVLFLSIEAVDVT